MESRNRNYAQSVQRNWQRKVYDGECAIASRRLHCDWRNWFFVPLSFSFASGLLWAIGSASWRMDAKNIEIPRCAMERFSTSPWRIHKQAERRVTIKVSYFAAWLVWQVNCIDFVLFGRVERSSDQVIKPVNLEALTKWVGQIPEDVVRDMAEIAPMLSVLGYDPYANPPAYGSADSFVKDNTLKVCVSVYWERCRCGTFPLKYSMVSI